MYELDRVRAEDGPVFERLLDQALRSGNIKEAVRRADGNPNAEQLRTQALRARASILAAAAIEYRSYLQLRESARQPRPAQQPTGTATETGGKLLPALGVLVPGLAATAAVIFLLFGLGLRAAGIPSRLASQMIFAGVTAAVVAVVATLAGLLWLLAAAARNRSTAYDTAPEAAEPVLARAHEEWQRAVLERGVMPFLLGQLDR